MKTMKPIYMNQNVFLLGKYLNKENSMIKDFYHNKEALEVSRLYKPNTILVSVISDI